MEGRPCENLPIRVNCSGFDMESMANFGIFRPGSPLWVADGKLVVDGVDGSAFFAKKEAADFFEEDERLPWSPPIMGS